MVVRLNVVAHAQQLTLKTKCMGVQVKLVTHRIQAYWLGKLYVLMDSQLRLHNIHSHTQTKKQTKQSKQTKQTNKK